MLVLSASLIALVSVQANEPINDADTYNTDDFGAKRFHKLSNKFIFDFFCQIY